MSLFISGLLFIGFIACIVFIIYIEITKYPRPVARTKAIEPKKTPWEEMNEVLEETEVQP